VDIQLSVLEEDGCAGENILVMEKPNCLTTAKDCIEFVQGQSRKCILMLSYGKDSLVTLDLIYPYFDEIYGIFMFFVDGLEHIDRWKRWCLARYPKLKIIHVPHWTLTYVLRGGLYCVANPKQKLLKLTDIVKAMRLKYNTEWVFLGMKKADSMNRRMMLNTYSEEHYVHMGMCYPLADFTHLEILAYMKQHGLPKPVLYGGKYSNGIGFNIDCFKWLREHFPDDLEKIYDTFPMSRRILMEYDIKKAREDELKLQEQTAEEEIQEEAVESSLNA